MNTRPPLPAVSDAQCADTVIRLKDAVTVLRRGGHAPEADAVEELLGAAQTFTHELAEAVAASEGYRGQMFAAQARCREALALVAAVHEDADGAYAKMYRLEAETSRALRAALELVAKSAESVLDDGGDQASMRWELGGILQLALGALNGSAGAR